MALAINPTLSVDPVLSRPLPSSPTLQPVKHLVLCYLHRPCEEASPPLHLLFPPSRGEKKRCLPSLSFQRIPACFRKYLQGSLLQEALSHLTFQVCLCGILQTEFCKDTWSILTPLETGNLRPSQQLTAFSRAQYWLGLGVSMVSYIALIPVSAWDHFMGDGLALVLLVSPPL